MNRAHADDLEREDASVDGLLRVAQEHLGLHFFALLVCEARLDPDHVVVRVARDLEDREPVVREK